MRSLSAALALCLAPGLAMATVSPLSEQLGQPIPFEALGPLTPHGPLVLIQEADGQLSQVTVITIVKGDTDAIMALVAEPEKHLDMSGTVESIKVIERRDGYVRFETEIDTPGLNSTVLEEMHLTDDRTITVSSSGHLDGNYVWRFTPLPGGYTGVEYSLFADMMSMGSFMRWVSHRAPSVQTGSNAVAGLVTVQGLGRMVDINLNGAPRQASSAKSDAPAPPLPPLAPMWTTEALAEAVGLLSSRGTLAWVGGGETVLMARLKGPPQQSHGRMRAEGGSYEMDLETPFKVYHVNVAQTAIEGDAFHEKIVGGSSVSFDWHLGFYPVQGGDTVATMRSAVDLSDSMIMRIAMGLDPAVGPAMRLAALLSPWARIKP